MKKILIVLLSILLSYKTSAYDFHNKKEYTTKKHTISNMPQVIEFFSFFCPYCYEFEKTHHIKKFIKNNTNTKIKIKTCHVNFLGGKLSYILTKSWIIAEQIGIEEKIILPIFKGVQETQTIHNITNIKKIFQETAGISNKTFDNFWNSFTIQILIKKNTQYIKKSHLDHIPVMFIKGKYIIDYTKLENIFKNDFSQKYIKLITFLIKLK